VDRTLQDITGIEKPMGGIPILLCGDFRQMHLAQEMLKNSSSWHQNIKLEMLYIQRLYNDYKLAVNDIYVFTAPKN
jgi:hypothetical protein